MDRNDTHLEIKEGVSVPMTEIHFQFVKSSGPGGQNVNKVNSQAQLFWNVRETEALKGGAKTRLLQQQANRINKDGILRIDCQISRDREKNRQECLNRLRQMIVEALTPPKQRKRTRTPKWVKERRLKNKAERSKVKRLRRPPSMNE